MVQFWEPAYRLTLKALIYRYKFLKLISIHSFEFDKRSKHFLLVDQFNNSHYSTLRIDCWKNVVTIWTSKRLTDTSFILRIHCWSQFLQNRRSALCQSETLNDMIFFLLAQLELRPPKNLEGFVRSFLSITGLRSQGQFAPKCSFLASRPLEHCSFRISW